VDGELVEHRSVKLLDVYSAEMNTLHNLRIPPIANLGIAKRGNLNQVGNIHPEFSLAKSGHLGFQSGMQTARMVINCLIMRCLAILRTNPTFVTFQTPFLNFWLKSI
jgi:hypothetical protein